MRAWRTELHREPELSTKETKTQEKILRALRTLDIPSRTYDGLTGVVGVLGSDRPGPTVALRADMDGLPITEDTGLVFASRVPGRMHACGHDVHMACLLGAGALLKRGEGRLRGPIRLIFQPAEEQGNPGGALPLIERGVLERPKVSFVVGQHVAPEIPLGSIGWRNGPLMASSDYFRIRVRGTGGHAGYPHRGPDAVLAATEIVGGLQSLVSRTRDPLDPVVISVGTIHGGTRYNILPEEVVIEGTVRTLHADTRVQMERALRHRVRHLAASSRSRASVHFEQGYPVTVNEPGATHRVVEALRREMGDDALVEIERPVMGAEDFSRYLERIPGTFLFLGVGEAHRPATLHSPTFAPSDQALTIGAACLAAAADGLQRSFP